MSWIFSQNISNYLIFVYLRSSRGPQVIALDVHPSVRFFLEFLSWVPNVSIGWSSPVGRIKWLTCPSVCVSVNFHNFRYIAYISYPIELKLGRIILAISPHNRLGPDFSEMTLQNGSDSSIRRIFYLLSGGTVKACVLQISNRFTAYSSYALELNLCRMILDIRPHNRSMSDFSISSQGALWRRTSWNV